MTTNPDKRRPATGPGLCRVCHTIAPVNPDDGRLRSHPAPVSPDVECDGTARLPLDGDR